MIPEEFIEYYTEEGCAYFALALNKITGFPIRMLVDEEEVYDDDSGIPSIHHVYVFDPETGNSIDVKGIRKEDELQHEWKEKHHNPLTTYTVTPYELRDYMGDDDEKPLYGYSDEEVMEADRIIRKYPNIYGLDNIMKQSEVKVVREILHMVQEARADRYMNMFNLDLIRDVEGYEDNINVRRIVERIITVFEKEPQIIWALRWYRLSLLRRAERAMKEMPYEKGETEYRELAKKDEMFFKKYGISESDIENGVRVSWTVLTREVEEYLYQFEHEEGVMDKLRSVNLVNTAPQFLMNVLREAEEDVRDKSKALVRYISSEDESFEETETLKKYPNGLEWHWVHLMYCEAEGKAMRHCGNKQDENEEGDEILSLREPIKKGKKVYWKPYLTFVLNQDTGMLKDMRGYANEKPNSKFHPYIMDILLMDEVKGLQGGSFNSENDFSLDDLSEEDRKVVEEKKPMLFGFKRRYDNEGPSKELVASMEEVFSSFDYSEYELKFLEDGSEDLMISPPKHPRNFLKDYFFSDSGNRHSPSKYSEDADPLIVEFWKYVYSRKSDSGKKKEVVRILRDYFSSRIFTKHYGHGTTGAVILNPGEAPSKWLITYAVPVEVLADLLEDKNWKSVLSQYNTVTDWFLNTPVVDTMSEFLRARQIENPLS